MMEFFRNKKLLATAFFLVLLCALVLGLAVHLFPNFSTIGTDGSLYTLLGKHLAEGKGFTTFGEAHTIFSPLLPLLIAVAFFFTDDISVAGHAPGILLLIGTIPLIYLLGETMWGRRVGLIAAFFTACSGYALWTGIIGINAQTIAGFLTPIFLLLLYRGAWKARERAGGPWEILLAGGVLGLLYLTRPEYFMIPPFALLFLWYFLRGAIGRKERSVTLAYFFLGFLFFAIPYITYLSATLGEFSFTGRANETALILVSNGTEGYESVERADGSPTVVMPPLLEGGILKTLTGNLGPLLERTIEGFLRTERSIFNTYGLIGMLMLAWGLRAIFERRKWAEFLILLLGIMPIVAVAAIQGGSGNYLVQYFPIFNIVTALGVVTFSREMGEWLSFSQAKKRVAGLFMTGAVALYLFFPVAQLYFFLPADYQDKEYTMLGQWMGENIPDIEKTKVLSRKPEPVVHAGASWYYLPYATSTDQLIAFMHRTEISYVIADSRTWRTLRPELMGLVEKTDVPDDFVLVYEADHVGQRALLYHLKEAEVPQ